MTTPEDVQEFLKQFNIKIDVFGIIYFDKRKKNVETLAILNITSLERKKIIHSLETDDYVKGPVPSEVLGGCDMWVFGKDVNGHAVYIKISLGNTNRQAICISFHIAEHPIDYPFKPKQDAD